MQNSKILFIVEGENDEVAFVKRLLAKCYANHHYEIYSYRCNIHVLAQTLINEYPSFEDDEVDIQLILKSKEIENSKRRILSQKYQDVFLIFDFDPQHVNPHFDTIIRMLDYFSDSADHGKLFINYPMMQSYKHFSILPDDSFIERRVSIDECRIYKRLVGEMSAFTDINKYSYITFVSLIVHHLRKANYILTGNYVIPSYEEYVSWSGSELFMRQWHLLESENYFHVLNTSIFLAIDFRPHDFLKVVSKRTSDFDI